MIVARTVPALRSALSALPRPLALVPTMGALHAGHLALLDAARSAGARSVVASVFVNPLQFGNPDDLAHYPRTEEGDLAALQAAGCDVAWLPTVDAMYPPGACTVIEVGGPSAGFEGAARPGHFRGVATVVGKLFHQTGADLAMFGEKDWQQVQVVRRMAADLDWPITIVPVPTVREPDGLALSSRNRFLSAAERSVAPVFYRVLQEVAEGLRHGRAGALALGEAALRTAGLEPEYLALVDGASMRVVETPDQASRLIGLVRLGSVRLLDNVAVFG
jgi:pantoate--beta-alanine ligase